MKNIKTNPLITKIEKGAKLGATLTGYKWGNEKTHLRLATDLTGKYCYRIKEKDILHWKYINKKEGEIELYLKDGAEIEQIIQQTLKFHPPFHPFPSFDPAIPEINRFIGIIQQTLPFENNFRFNLIFLYPGFLNAAALDCVEQIRRNSNLTVSIPGPNGSLLRKLTEEGRNQLRTCLSRYYFHFALEMAYADAAALLEDTVAELKP